eukprot:TRINITY_DN2118_c0_g1_i2.p1 TRINITY_DN2118_c0_g1~~TRINITY_DN2118_c0_g1_i2.p1  ORF type:complete len:769 (+),score=208.04 TRINITY_DN2118_c0_g1_i2:90-2396(+)
MKKLLILFAFLIGYTLSAIPHDWTTNNMMLATDTKYDTTYAPYIGNGFVATRINYDHMFVSGVFNGRGRGSQRKTDKGLVGNPPSHRAAIPSLMLVEIQPVIEGSTVSLLASGLEVYDGYFVERYGLNDKRGSSVCEFDFIRYASRSNKNIMVVMIQLDPKSNEHPDCQIKLKHNFLPHDTTDFTRIESNIGGEGDIDTWTAYVKEAESTGTANTRVFLAWDRIEKKVLTLKKDQPSIFRIEVSVSLPNGSLAKQKVVRETLWEEHKTAWNKLNTLRVDSKDKTLAQKTASSFYYILSSVRADWPYGLSPGGISSNAYNGHSFWDTETWMFPNMNVLYPEIARSLINYRFSRIGAAEKNAIRLGWKGTDFPWESAETGAETCPMFAKTQCDHEQHINGDIAMAVKQHFHVTKDVDWLEKIGWPLTEGICDFFTSRVVVEPQSGAYTILQVTPPDEHAGAFTNSSAYTNGVMSMTMEWCSKAADRLGKSSNSRWLDMEAKPYLPLVNDLFKGGKVHPEYDGYAGQTINQADVALLQYPLMMPMNEVIAINDLEYYTSVTDPDGYFTGDSAYSVAWLDRGRRDSADEQMKQADLHMKGPFLVWVERAKTDGHLNFLTGAGGYLQNIIFGYLGIRVLEDRLRINWTTLDNDVTLKSVEYCGAKFDVEYSMTAETKTATFCGISNCSSKMLVVHAGDGSVMASLEDGDCVDFAHKNIYVTCVSDKPNSHQYFVMFLMVAAVASIVAGTLFFMYKSIKKTPSMDYIAMGDDLV